MIFLHVVFNQPSVSFSTYNYILIYFKTTDNWDLIFFIYSSFCFMLQYLMCECMCRGSYTLVGYDILTIIMHCQHQGFFVKTQTGLYGFK